MPYLELMVNVQIPNETEFALAFSKIGAQAMNRPEGYISVSITYNKTLSFAGTFEPAFALNVTGLDDLTRATNEKNSAIFSEFFQSTLGIPNDRGYIVFKDAGRAFIGYKGTTWATLLEKMGM
ncbi:Tautomerase/MIF superfamily [Mycena maculata]|uniref:L-dopachrome isomerase n=1 Tax=Mycena maculata TaxID=230809 RepID=A0AAD7K2H7_9AGAR|nr:Tautomerase/MIF superfamily [Mycena maculata]